MSKYRIKYSQDDRVKYISHLDFLRTVTRIFSRAEFPVKFSNGFNPHVVMTIGLPLSVGITSVCDVLDVELTEDIDTPAAINKLNENSPSGIRFLSIKPADGLKPLHEITSAVYTAYFNSDKTLDIKHFIEADTVIAEKKSKRGLNCVNIKDYVFNLTEIDPPSGYQYGLRMHIHAGNFSNLKPELLLSSLGKTEEARLYEISINREMIFFDDGSEV